MASRSLGILRKVGKVAKQRLRVTVLPRHAAASGRSNAFLASRSAISRAPRSIFQGPLLDFERQNAAQLGFCVKLAPLATDSPIAFRSMNRVARNCLASVVEGEGEDRMEITSLEQLETGPFLQNGCNGAVYAARLKTEAENLHRLLQPDLSHWPLVFKMIFNYGGEDNGCEPSKAEVVEMFRAEAVPFSVLPEHPCVAKVTGVFVDDVPRLQEALEKFPMACPQRLYPERSDGCMGREKTLFVVMKRYSSSLSERLAAGPLGPEEAERLLLQLLEANVLLQQNGVAHRDLHEKNVLLTERADGKLSACIADFGCSTTRLQRPRSDGFDLFSAPGNGCFQAPECSDSTPQLDYRKSDLWSTGAIAYSLFSPGDNPFVKTLDAHSYRDSELPPVAGAPSWLNRLVLQMLRRDPRQRPSSTLCADVMQLQALRPPSAWLFGPRPPSAAEVRNWMLLKAAELILTFRNDEDQRLRLFFFNRLTEASLTEALAWLRDAFGSADLGQQVAEIFDPKPEPELELAIVAEE